MTSIIWYYSVSGGIKSMNTPSRFDKFFIFLVFEREIGCKKNSKIPRIFISLTLVSLTDSYCKAQIPWHMWCVKLQSCNESTFSPVRVLHVSALKSRLSLTGQHSVQQVSSLSPGVCLWLESESRSGNFLALVKGIFHNTINNITIV